MRSRPSTAELVPLADRFQYMALFRLGAAIVTVAAAIFTRSGDVTSAPRIAAAAGAYGVVSLAVFGIWRQSRARGVALFGATLVADGAFLAWAAYATGGPDSPVRYVILLHVVAVTLLGAHRTGLKVAFWDTLTLLVVYYAQRSHLLVPLSGQHVGIGIGTPFDRLIEFASACWVAAVATAALSAVNERELRRRRYDLEALATMATALEETVEPDGVARVIVDSVADTFDLNRVVLIAAGEESPPFVLAAHGTKATDPRPNELRDDSVIATAWSKRATLLVTRLDATVDRWLASILPNGRKLVVVPMFADRQPVGVLIAEHAVRSSTRIERRVVGMLERFVSHAALALRNAWLNERIREAAATDGLTGIANRATFEDALVREIGRAQRQEEPLGLVLFDIDHFKRLNDTYGHQAGDDVLRHVAHTLRQSSREFDLPARFGGEEFALLLPATGPHESVEIAHRLRGLIGATPDGPAVTVSAGVASFPLDAESAVALVAAADEALYESKRRGRDRVSVYEPTFVDVDRQMAPLDTPDA